MQSSLPARRMRRTQDLLGALLVMLLVMLLVVLALTSCAPTTASARSSLVTPSLTAPRVTTTPAEPLVVSDAQDAQAVSFASVQNNDIWVSLHGAQPRQMTHLGLDPQESLDWMLIWSPDASQLLASESPFTSQGQAWLLSLPSGTVSPFPLPCLGPCFWLGERYIVYMAGGGTHYMQVKVYDVQQRRAIPSALDAQQIVDDVETRGSAVYFTPYPLSSSPTPQDGLVKRFDLAANSISTAYTLPGPVIIEGIPLAGSWDLSADGSQLVDAFGNPLTVHCPQSACYTYFQDSAGTIAPIFPSHQSPLAGLIPQPMISPDGTMAVAVVSAISGDGSPQYSLVQQALPAGEEITSAILPVPQAASPTVLGWTTGDAILLSQPSLEADGPTRVLVGASGSSDAAKLVETIQVTSQSGQIIFAPISLR